jgi:hypothetical protein
MNMGAVHEHGTMHVLLSQQLTPQVCELAIGYFRTHVGNTASRPSNIFIVHDRVLSCNVTCTVMGVSVHTRKCEC